MVLNAIGQLPEISLSPGLVPCLPRRLLRFGLLPKLYLVKELSGVPQRVPAAPPGLIAVTNIIRNVD